MRVAGKQCAWYSKGLPGSAEFRATVNRIEEAEAVRQAINAFYTPLIDRQAA